MKKSNKTGKKPSAWKICLLILLIAVFAAGTVILSPIPNLPIFGEKAGKSTNHQEKEKKKAAGDEKQPPAPTEVVEEEPKTETITISSVGDLALGKLYEYDYSNSFLKYYDSYGADYFLKNASATFAADDLTLGNFEGTLTDSNNKTEKTFNIKAPKEYASILTAGHVDVVGTGNNHIIDYGEQGSKDTWDALTEYGIPYAHNDKTVLYETSKGIKVGIVASNVLNSANNYFLLDGVKSLREQGAQIVIAMPHWGIERQYLANKNQTDLAHQLVDAGCDLVLGSHPHVLQTMEVYKGKMIAYSQGNFCFGVNRNPKDKETMIYQQTFTFVDGVLQSGVNVHVIPYTLSSNLSTNDYCPKEAEGDQKTKIIDHLNSYSEEYSDFKLDNDGNFQM